MKVVESLFAGVSRLLKVEAEAKEVPRNAANLLANFGAIVLNGLFFPTAAKILGAGLLLTWFLDELKASALHCMAAVIIVVVILAILAGLMWRKPGE